ncbi:hypothetical protein OHC33_005729 [Knufia fluminis]|uniref:Uncharacterized protein n=1 Tax=Knufia fluminis TaxID=191047 RepID=A0AAN8ET92_9EURO|nr:hypothetical protein OHC33_005729 [Knufia fluminis]
MDTAALAERIKKLREHTDPPPTTEQSPSFPTRYIEHEGAPSTSQDNLHGSTTPAQAAWTAIRSQIRQHRVPRTAASRIIDQTISKITANHPLTILATRALFNKLYLFFASIAQLHPDLLPPDINITKLKHLLHTGNQREHFMALRILLPPLRNLLKHLVDLDTDTTPSSLLRALACNGIINPTLAHHLVSNRAFNETKEILAAPAHLILTWKPVAVKRIAPEDKDLVGAYSRALWGIHLRVRDITNPPLSPSELQSMFGSHATPTSHANHHIPWESGAHKYKLIESDPFDITCTQNNLHTTSGPWGTAWRYLNMWLLFGGSRDKLLEIVFAIAAMLLGLNHHSLVEVLHVTAMFRGVEGPGSLVGVVEGLVPRDLEMVWDGEEAGVTRGEFYGLLCGGLDGILA